MKKFILFAGLIAVSYSAVAGNIAPTQCAVFARSVMKVALHAETRGIFKLDDVKTLKEYNDEAGVTETVEQLSFMSEGAYVVVQSFPNYYSDGKCQLKSISISRH